MFLSDQLSSQDEPNLGKVQIFRWCTWWKDDSD